MNLISRLLPASNVLLDLPASSKKRAFEQAGYKEHHVTYQEVILQ